MKLQGDVNCISLINIVYLLLYCVYDLLIIYGTDFLCYFFGCARQEKLFFGSISMLEIIFWADGLYPSLSTPILNIYEYPSRKKSMLYIYRKVFIYSILNLSGNF